jgi:hypothetical protein
MALSIWTQQSGYKFNAVQERAIVNQQLPVSYGSGFDDSTSLNFKVISGKLPTGLRLENDVIVGTPYEVPRPTEFEFVIRASYNNQIADRTFFWTVEGQDEPTWETAAGALPLGANDQYYILDSSYIDFQLQVTDFDTAAGQELKFFQPKNGGQLPPGLILTRDGRLVGWIQPALAIPETSGNGSFDNTQFDSIAYDFGNRSSNGYDSYIYDIVNFDYSISSLAPKKLNRYYEFLVTVTDGDTSSTRKFKIFVVGDDYFRADNVGVWAGNGTFTVDGTYVRAPIWITPKNLGVRRANNYLTFKLDTYDGLELGPITYNLDTVNPTLSATAFTSLSTENRVGTNLVRIKNSSGIPVNGNKLCLKDYVAGAGNTTYTIVNVLNISNEYVLTVFPFLDIGIQNNTRIELGTESILPNGLQFDQGTAEVFGIVPYQPAITKTYSFTVTATRLSDRDEKASAKRTFTVQTIGEIDSIMNWNSSPSLGSIGANYISNLFLSASSTLSDSVILYVKTSGNLPPGLTLQLDGEITGKVNQFGTTGNGLTTIDGGDFILDASDTTIDRDYTFAVEARDILSYSAISQTFTLKIDTPNDRLYSTMVVKPFLKQIQRDYFREFITDSNIFDSASIYRPSDPNFGIQSELKMLVYAGIETKAAGAVQGAIGRNHKPKKFKLGDVKKAQAKLRGTNEVIYEVIYLDVVDPLEIGKTYLPAQIFTVGDKRSITVDQNNQYYNGPFTLDTAYWNPADPFYVSVDRNNVFADDPNSSKRFPVSIRLWRERIKSLGLRDRDYLPLWMRTIQDGTVNELDWIPAIPLCYCKPGRADDILLNIKNHIETTNFDFKTIDYIIDRYIIDSVTGYSADKYIVFENNRTSIT